jgi:hypothetical protein
MKLSLGMKVGLVSLFSCLALLLGLLSSTSMASAHSANTLQTAQISVTAFGDHRGRGDFGRLGDPSFQVPSNFQVPSDKYQPLCPATTLQGPNCVPDPSNLPVWKTK